ncbi:unnamed protein product [Vitrella brassicaformis CCMP3155]|uniref:Maltose/galactoside acetyltransferase domain-containing protein n=1 Tax=Vitrella brassicaformis (strain CCMP3155) TaxID=1169540 RepID=A0A0G4GP28_VITBC|nr:unnamed protein product [Vitrella brassicaformis CCMP3155]|eukprot:CEM31930.1 unnamed protein product [Vitrella brassicaformis CCMP3155]
MDLIREKDGASRRRRFENEEFRKMVSGELYRVDELLNSGLREAKIICEAYNNRRAADVSAAANMPLLRMLFGAVGEGSFIEPPLRVDYGFNTELGRDVYMNYDTVILDVAPVKIGSFVKFGPGVHIYTAGHPLDPQQRKDKLEYGQPITIEDNVWVGGRVCVMPGVTIGRNSVIGAGSVVTKSIPPDCVAVGVPCKVVRKLPTTDGQDQNGNGQDEVKGA